MSFRSIWIIKLCIIVFIFSHHDRTLNAQNFLPFKYLVGTTEPDSGWKNKDYNDTSWTDGRGSIGFGDNDDSTVIANVPSVYLRYHLNNLNPFPDLNWVEAIVLDVDFDDGFIAYLNGKELLRINMNEAIESPAHDQLALRSHEAEFYRTGLSNPYDYNGYYFDSTIYKACGLDSNSILAFEVHNDSMNGSDLSFFLNLKFVDDTITDYVWSTHHFDFNYRSPVKIDSSELPIVVIETDEFGFPETKDDIYAFMGIIDNAPGIYNKPGDLYSGYSGKIRTHLRGSFSFEAPKRCYAIETQDETGNNNNVSLMGMPAENDWILYGPYFDKSLIRNELAFILGKKMGYYEPATRFCEVIINGENYGIHVLTEKIKRDKNRVDISALNPEENSWPEISGGYIFKIDHTEDIEVVYPDEDKITGQQIEYMNSFYDSVSFILKRSYFRDPLHGYRKYLDAPSLIDFFIISELSRNLDAYTGSMFMYKDNWLNDGKITYGPLWDYDFGFITHYFRDREQEWRYSSYTPILRCFEDTAFTNQTIDRWFSLRDRFLHTDSLSALIDSIIQPLRPYITRNYQVWPSINKPYSYLVIAGNSYEEEIAIMKSWIGERAAWIDENIVNIQRPYSGPFVDVSEFNQGTELTCYPNPFFRELNIELQSTDAGILKMELIDITGRTLYHSSPIRIQAGINSLTLTDLNEIPEGYYILKTYINDVPYISKSVIKIR